MEESVYEFRGRVWLWKSDPSIDSGEGSGWHFVSVDRRTSGQIEREYPWPWRGFGSIPVEVLIGKTKWRTSIFPDKKKGKFLLPLKRQVRAAEGISAGDEVLVELRVLE